MKDNFYYTSIYSGLEPIFQGIYDVVRYFDNPQLFFIITGTIIYGLLIICLLKESEIFSISLAIFVFTNIFFIFSLSFIRQFMAVMLIFYGARYLFKNKIIYILIVILTSILVHNSAIICLVFILIPKYKIKFYEISLGFFFAAFFYKFFINFLLKKIVFLQKYSYLAYRENIEPGLVGMKGLIIFFVLILIAEYLEKLKNEKFNNKYYFYKNSTLIGLMLIIFFNYTIGGHFPLRIGWYFIIFSILLASELFAKLTYKQSMEILIIFLIYGLSINNLIESKFLYESYIGKTIKNFSSPILPNDIEVQL